MKFPWFDGHYEVNWSIFPKIISSLSSVIKFVPRPNKKKKPKPGKEDNKNISPLFWVKLPKFNLRINKLFVILFFTVVVTLPTFAWLGEPSNTEPRSGEISNIKIESEVPTDSQIQRYTEETDTFKITLDVLSDRYNWIFESHTEIEKDGQATSVKDIMHDLFVDKKILPQDLQEVDAIIPIGAASQEGGEVSEELRASNRTGGMEGHIKKIFKDVLRIKVPVYRLSLGKYVGGKLKSNNPDQTKHQRRVMIMSAKEKTKEINNYACELYKAMKLFPKHVIDVDKYSQFDFHNVGDVKGRCS